MSPRRPCLVPGRVCGGDIGRGSGPLRALLACLILCAAVLGGREASAGEPERLLYRQALQHLQAGRLTEFRAARERLDGYVLRPYLDYHELVRRLDDVSEAQMRAFRSAHADLPVTRLIYHRWLARLGARSDWAALARNAPDTAEPELQCLYLRGRIATGDTAALAAVAPLWTVGRSQPRACDPLFERWIASGLLDQTAAWDRLALAVAADQPGLARYLLRYLQGATLRAGQSLYEVHVSPEAVLERQRFQPDSRELRIALAHGLQRLAAGNPDLAEAAWNEYRTTHALTPEQNVAIAAAILRGRARIGRVAEPWPPDLGVPAPGGLAQELAQLAVNRQQWDSARYWIARIDPASQADTRWQYWSARAGEAGGGDAAASRARYQALARERDYYGFLAAARAGLPPQLNAAPPHHDPEVDRALRSLPAVRRALELHAVGDLLNARREWYRLLPTLDPAQQVHAAYLAQQSGWIPQSIQIANAAQLRDHVDLRFPVVYPDIFAAVSQRTAVAKPFLLAIARQESLFDPAARSSADARGVMQLLPSTANQVARLADLAPPRVQQLHEPTVNVELGGRYLAQLLDRYDNRHPLAAAAYNAGPGRVDRWVRERAGEPLDIWIENIPFGETRNYVKNVMAFTQVYGQLLDTPLPMPPPDAAVVRSP